MRNLSHVFCNPWIKSDLFLCLLFIVYIPITAYHSHSFKNFLTKHVNRHSRQIYEANLFNNNLTKFNKFLTTLKCSVELNFEFNDTVDSCMNSNFYTVDFYSLVQFTRLNIFKALTPESISITISLNPLFLWLPFFLNVFLHIFKEWAWKEVIIPCSPLLEGVVAKSKLLPKYNFFTRIYALDKVYFNYQFKNLTISNIMQINKKIHLLDTASNLR